MGFSERLGYKKPKIKLEFNKVDAALKNGLWDVLVTSFFDNRGEIIGRNYRSYSNFYDELTKTIWHSHFKPPMDDRPSNAERAHGIVREKFLTSSFPDTYEFLEFMASLLPVEGETDYTTGCNKILEREKSAFRFIGRQLIQITNKSEIAEIEKTQDQKASSGVSTHINAAIALYSDRKNPDYRNSIKESISAVEAAAKDVAGSQTKTLGDALKVLEKNGVLHTALKKGFSSLYGWTNDSDGIRHAIMDEPNLTEADARYMLVSCSAFANYLLSKKLNN